MESEWSDFDPIFHTDEGDLTQELQEQNELNTPDRQVNIDDVLEKLKKDQELAHELGRQYGALAIVIFYRANQYGSLFDHELFAKLDTARQARIELLPTKIKINFYVQKVMTGIQECFAAVNSDKEGAVKDPAAEDEISGREKPTTLSIVQAY